MEPRHQDTPTPRATTPPPIPSLAHPAPRPKGRRRDRHGRGLRGLMYPPVHPAYRTRRERFDECVVHYVDVLRTHWERHLQGMEFAVEDVPPSDPSPWEAHGVPMGRFFTGGRGQATRIVVYRRPIEARAEDADDVEQLIRDVIVEQVAYVLGRNPSDIDPNYEGQ